MTYKAYNFNDSIVNEQIMKMWNDEYGFIFPISKELFNKNSKACYSDASFLAYDEDKLVGFILTKIWEEPYEIGTYKAQAWINLFYVLPKYRRQGIGSTLLDKVVEVVKGLGKTTLNLGKDLNCYVPGLPEDFKTSLAFFTNRGFDFGGQTHDLINDHLSIGAIKNKDHFSFRLASIEDKDAIIEFLKANWPGRWTYEALWYFNAGGSGKEYMLGFNEENKIVAFAKLGFPSSDTMHTSFSMTWRNRFERLGGVGPLGVDANYRKIGLGRDIVVAGMNAVMYEEPDRIIIDWTGLMDFYRKMGFEVWKVYNYLSKTL